MEDWRQLANCLGADTDLFFPERGQSRQLRVAQSVCKECVVKEECLEYALGEHIKHGVWGETSERQRRRLRNGKT